MPEAGWYPDPHNPNQQRYWDGSTWTEHTHDAPFHLPSQGPTPTAGATGQINDIGDWLNRSFKVLFANAMPLFLLLLVGILPVIIGYWVFAQAFDGVSISMDDGSWEGLSGSQFIWIGLTMVALMVLSAALSVMQSRLLHRAHMGHGGSLGDAVSVGLRNTPRFLLAGLVIYIAFILAVIVAAGIIALIAAVVGPLAALFGFVAVIAAVIAAFWLWIKASFLSVAAAAAPRGESILRSSFGLSSGRFWPIAGRLLLIWLLTTIVASVAQNIVGSQLLNDLTVASDGQLVFGGERLEDMDRFVLTDFLPAASAKTLTLLAISGLVTGAIGLFNRSGVAALYGDAGGPSDYEAVELPAEAS